MRRQLLETLGVTGKIVVENGEPFVDVTCHQGQNALLNVSQTTFYQRNANLFTDRE